MLREGLGLVLFLCMPNPNNDDVLVHMNLLGSHLETDDMLCIGLLDSSMYVLLQPNFVLSKIDFAITECAINICSYIV